jgi:phosphohistidine phosphatase
MKRMSDSHRLYVIRHAVAAERGDAYPDDSKRPLTPDGMSRFRKTARGLARLDAGIDCILCSPLVRARQTADILAQALPDKPRVVETATLVPGADFRELAAELENHKRSSAIALVGHEPGVGEIAARLIGLRHPFQFKKGAVCRIDVETLPPAGPGRLRWFATSKMLAKLAK